MAARILTSSDLPASLFSSGDVYHEADDLEYGLEVRLITYFSDSQRDAWTSSELPLRAAWTSGSALIDS